MTKQDIIEDIRQRNHTAKDEFLTAFNEEDLLAYLHQLREVESEHRRQDRCDSQTTTHHISPHHPHASPKFTSYKQYVGRSGRRATTCS